MRESKGGKLLLFRPTGDAAAGVTSRLADESLIAACATGDGAALGELFERFHAPVYRFLSRMLGCQCPDLDDLVQSTFLEVLRSAPRFQRRSAVQTWILGIAANLSRHHTRSEARRRTLLTGVAQEVIEPRAAPDQDAERHQLLNRLSGLLTELPHELREAFILCDVEEIPGVEVARVLNIREGTLWRRLHEARKRLRSALFEGRDGN
jgi:RNA polymerase sigma factor (sigma-70 family)